MYQSFLLKLFSAAICFGGQTDAITVRSPFPPKRSGEFGRVKEIIKFVLVKHLVRPPDGRVEQSLKWTPLSRPLLVSTLLD